MSLTLSSKQVAITVVFVTGSVFGAAAIGQTTSPMPPASGTSTMSSGSTAKKAMPAASSAGTNSGASKLPDSGAPKSKGDGKGG